MKRSSEEVSKAPMPENAAALFIDAKAVHESAFSKIEALKGEAYKADLPTLANMGYALRETEKYITDLRKDISSLRGLVALLFCRQFASDTANMTRENIKTEYCTCSPQPNIQAQIPTFDKSPAEYTKLMDYLGVDPMLRDQGSIETENGIEDTEVLRVHWPAFQSLMRRLAAAGVALPDGIDTEKTFTEFTLLIRRSKGVLE